MNFSKLHMRTIPKYPVFKKYRSNQFPNNYWSTQFTTISKHPVSNNTEAPSVQAIIEAGSFLAIIEAGSFQAIPVAIVTKMARLNRVYGFVQKRKQWLVKTYSIP